MNQALKTSAFALLVLSSLLVALSVLRFFMPEPAAGPEILLTRAAYPAAFALHVFLGGLALAIGPVQFLAGVRRRWRMVHRMVGRVYVAACLVSAVGGLVIALGTRSGPVAMAGFTVLAVLWFAFTAQGLRLALQRRFEAHGRWMLRSFALTFAAVTLRLMLPLAFMSGLPMEAAYPAIAWLCWTVNLVAVELWLRRGAIRVFALPAAWRPAP